MKWILYEVSERVAYITLNRPEKRNALSHELVAELDSCLVQAEKDEQVKVVVLRANGEAFCAGADLAYLQQLQHFSFEENLSDSLYLKQLFLRIYQLEKVVIAQVQGHALAGGCGLATVCDYVFAVPAAKFGYTEVKIGFVPALVMVFLLRKLGDQRARKLLLSGDAITASQALELGLITAVVEPDQLSATVNTFVRKLIRNNSGQSMKLTKQLIDAVQSLPLEQALQLAAETNARARATEDCKRGIAAFLNREEITW